MKKQILLILLSIPVIGFSQEMTTSLKIYGLSVAWEKAKTNFPHFDKLHTDWDSLYLQNIPKVVEANDIKDYYNILIKFYAKLNDGHTWIWYPDSINNSLNTIPIRTTFIEGKLIVSKVLNETLNDKIAVGDEIISIDDYEISIYANKHIFPFISSSTSQDRNLRAYTYDLFLGDIENPVKLKIKHSKDQSIDTLTISRKLVQINDFKEYEYKKLENNVGYLKINTFYSTNYKTIFDSIYSNLLNTNSLIIDLRENGGGSGEQANYILSHFLQKPTQTASYKLRKRETNEWETYEAGTIYPIENKTIYDKPIILLIGSGTFSAAEDFCVAFINAKRGDLIGTNTAGSTGNSIEFDLPYGGFGQVTFKRDFFPDGKEFVGVGIEPNIVVDTKIDDIITNNDSVLNRAILELKNKY